MSEQVFHFVGAKRLGRRVLGTGLIAFMAGCSTNVRDPTAGYPAAAQEGAKMPRPARVLVYDFTIDWQTVVLDSGLRARLEQAMRGGGLSEQQREVAADVERAIGDTLVQQIRGMGLDAVRAPAATIPGPNELAVRGRITRIDAGNQTRRRMIGFGAGKSEIQAHVEVLGASPGRAQTLLQSDDVEADSGHAPGLALGGAEAAAGHAVAGIAGGTVAAASRSQSGLPELGQRLARRTARDLGRFFYQEGWISAPPA